MKIYAIRKIKFDAGHRVVNHESKCRTLHGHEYWAHIYAKSNTGLDSLGRVIDFSVIKDRIGGWIDDHFDHNMIIWKAENIAEYLIKHICPSMLEGTGIKVPRIRLYETTNCYVEVEIDC